MPKNITDNRHSIRLKGYDYTQCGGYFVTLCAFQKECFFGDMHNGAIHLNRSGRTVTMEWLKTEEIRDNVKLDAFVVMPNHFHGVIFLTDTGRGRASQQDAPTETNVGATRRVALPQAGGTQSHRVAQSHPVAPTSGPASGSIGAIVGQFKSVVTKKVRQTGMEQFHWHRNYYERIIRNDEELNRIREYIYNNPQKWSSDIENPATNIDKSIKDYYDFSP